jgi:proteasome lid subunit RPN8/RPN11
MWTPLFVRIGRETFPHECCGAMLGKDGVVRRSLQAAEYDGRRGRGGDFSSAPTITASAEKRAREAGLDLLGFYHSHPDHPAGRRSTISITRGRFFPT